MTLIERMVAAGMDRESAAETAEFCTCTAA